jgi:hypothetical protein
MERADALFYTVFAETITRVLHWNTKFVEYPRAGEARIACEVSPARMGPAAGTHRGTLRVREESPSFPEGRIVKG